MDRKNVFLTILAVFILSMALVACGGGGSTSSGSDSGSVAEAPQATEAPAGDPVAGKASYDTVCIACHGPGGVGVTGLGKPFTASEFLLTVNDAELLEFIKTGRP